MTANATTAPLEGDSSQMELRPRERLLRYLQSEFRRPEFKDGSRLPTNKELARRAGVSPGTVQSVLRAMARRGLVRARRGSGTYLVQSSEEANGPLRVGIGVPLARLQKPDGWMSKIAAGIFQAALSGQVAIEGISDRSPVLEQVVKELEEKRDQLDALILFPYTLPPQKDSLIQEYENAGKPVIHIYPPFPTATANFSTTDFFDPCHAIGRAWKITGRRRAVFLSNETEFSDIRANISNQLRYAGVATGLGHHASSRDETRLTILQSPDRSGSVEAGYESIKKLLSREKAAPDAVFCAGDWLALGAYHALRDAGIGVPEQTSVAGASGLDLSRTDCPNLTRISHRLEEVGKSAMEMVRRRIALKGMSLPGAVLPASWIGGATTRRKENSLLPLVQAS